ncbi:MAG: hypothetical protein PVF83_02960 [Anaerolineales bacterium]|jgi:hypothetical protein
MDAFDFVDDKSKKSRGGASGLIWKLGTAYFLIGTLCLGVFFAYTFLYPNNPLNPFPPAPGITPAPTQSNLTPTNTPPPPPTSTLPPATEEPTLGPLPTATPFATGDATPTTGSSSLTHFKAQEGTPLYLAHTDGCGGLYIAGNVVDLAGNPVVFMLVRVGGTLGGENLQLEDTLSGSNPNYSSSGWEVKIADAPIDSTGTVFVELYRLESEDPVSDLIIVDTFNDCDRNLIMVNFVQDE